MQETSFIWSMVLEICSDIWIDYLFYLQDIEKNKIEYISINKKKSIKFGVYDDRHVANTLGQEAK